MSRVETIPETQMTVAMGGNHIWVANSTETMAITVVNIAMIVNRNAS